MHVIKEVFHYTHTSWVLTVLPVISVSNRVMFFHADPCVLVGATTLVFHYLAMFQTLEFPIKDVFHCAHNMGIVSLPLLESCSFVLIHA